jgi:hypothetical protein
VSGEFALTIAVLAALALYFVARKDTWQWVMRILRMDRRQGQQHAANAANESAGHCPSPLSQRSRRPKLGTCLEIYKCAVLTVIAVILACVWLNDKTPLPVRVRGGTVDVDEVRWIRQSVDVEVQNTVDVEVRNTPLEVGGTLRIQR